MYEDQLQWLGSCGIWSIWCNSTLFLLLLTQQRKHKTLTLVLGKNHAGK
jgi:hypothetical protein